ncbi:cytoplasmic protein [Lampropedia puyangensis]|uniref:Cytoplasmic protein n=2 Tax=Lampropedia puyangensis TaxID=1330072 RepID=A0A4S8EVY8_9BURK|nr:cytoplasmic protein [Lampropedia puyangensis]
MREILHSQRCGCYYCLRSFKPSKIEQWSEDGPDTESQNEQQLLYTAWCPYCGIDAVIGSAAGYPLTKEFLTRMRKRSFGI